MATQEEILKYSLQTDGKEGLDQIAKAMADTGKAGSESGVQLQKLVDELGLLLDTAKQVAALSGLQDRLADVNEKSVAATATLEKLNAEFGQAGPRTAEVAAQFASAEKAAAQLSAQQANLTVRVATASAALSTAGVDVSNLAAAETELSTKAQATAAALAETAAEVNRSSAGLAALETDASGAAAALDSVAAASRNARASEEAESITVAELGEKYRNFGQILETLKGLVVTLGAIATFDKLKDGVEEVVATGDKLQKWQIQLTNLYGSIAQGHEAFEKLEEVAHNTPLTLSQVMESAISMKRQGLDPLNGTLETLIKANKVYGGSFDELSGVIEGFAKESAKGELSSRLLMQMQLAGIPAVRLLGEAMGKTEDQIRAMAAAGDLGADAMGLLLAQLKKVGDNPAATGMTTIQAQVNSVKKSWEEFLDLIAKSGLYEFARQEITQVGTALKTALADGEAKQKAQAISDAIVGIGKAAAGIIGFLHDHYDAIKLASEAYGGLKIAMFAVDLASMVAKWAPATAATVANTLQTQANALAQRELAANIAAAGVASGEEATKLAALVLAMQRAAGGATLLVEEQIALAAAEVRAAEAAQAETLALQANAAAKLKQQAAAAIAIEAKIAETAATVAATEAKVAETAATAAGTASIGSSAKSILTTITSLGSLRAALNVVGGAATALVGGPWIALIAALGFVAKATYDAWNAFSELNDVTEKLDKVQKENAQTQLDLAAKAKLVAQQTKEAADIQIQSAKQIAAMSVSQAAQYEEQLQAAIKYFTALRIAARADGNKTQADEYTQKLGLLVVALTDVKNKFGEVGEAGEKGAVAAQKAISTLADQIFKLRVQGVAAPAAIQGAFEKLKIDQPEGLAKFLGVLSSVKNFSGDVADALKSKLVAELEKLNEIQFAAFEKNVEDAFDHGKKNAEVYQQIIRAIAQVDMLKLGFSAQQAGLKFEETGGRIVAAFAGIARNATSTGDQIQLAFAKALSQAQTEGEIDALKSQLTAAFNAGRIGADQFRVAMEAAGRKTAEIKVAALEAEAGLDGVGKAGQTAAQRTIDALDVMRGHLVAQANEIATKLAAAMQSGADPKYIEALRAKSKELDGEINEVTSSLEKMGNAGASATGKFLLGVQQAAAGAQFQREQMAQGEKQSQSFADAIGKLTNQSETLQDRMTGLAEATKLASNDTEKAKVAAEGLGVTMEKDAGIASILAGAMQVVRAQFSAVSDEAAKMFDRVFQGALATQGIFPAATAAVSGTADEMERLRQFAEADIVGLEKWQYALAQAQAAAQQKLEDQRGALAAQIAMLDSLGVAGQKNFGFVNQSAQRVLDNLLAQKQALQDGNSGFEQLGSQGLQPLQQALDSAIQRTQQLANEAAAAKDAYKSLSDQLQDQADQNAGNLEAVEDRRYKKQIEDIKAAAEKADELGGAQYQQDIANADAIHAKNMANIESEAKAKQSGSNSSSSSSSSSSSASTSSASDGGNASAGQAGVVYHATYNQSFYGFGSNEMRDFARQMKVELDRIGARSR